MVIMKKIVLILLLLLLSLPALAQYKPIPKDLSSLYRAEVTQIIDTQYPIAVRRTKQIGREAHKMYLKVLKNNDIYMTYATNNYDMIIDIGEFNLLSKIVDATDKYVSIKNDDALATGYNGDIFDFLDPYFKDNQIKTKKLDNLTILVNKKYNEILKEQQLLYKLYYRFGGKLQQQYEKEKSLKYKDFEKYTALYIVQQDLKNYRCCRKSIYGEVIYLIDNADETNHRFLLQIKKNFDNCSKNLKCWQSIEIDDYNYDWLDNATKFVIWFNNMVYLTK